jgi:fucose 4-O-acetylase-like acetyltransferase
MERQIEIDTVRGLACLLLVLYHVIGEPGTGLTIVSGPLRDINDFLAYVRMPLFTFLSGYVYAWRPFQSDAKSFIAGKARRLLIPLLVVGTTFAVIQSLVPGTNDSVDNWFLLHIDPYAHFWFLEALFLIFLLIVLLEWQGLLATPARVAFALVAAGFCYLYVGGVHWLSIAGAIYLLPYFLAGLACSRFSLTGRSRLPLFAIFWVASAALLLWESRDALASERSLSALLFGLASCVTLLSARIKLRVLAYIGLYSYAIYLFHAFFTAAARIALFSIGIKNIAVLLLVGCAAGVFGPLGIERLASRNRLANTLLLGKKWTPGLSWLYPLKIGSQKPAIK